MLKTQLKAIWDKGFVGKSNAWIACFTCVLTVCTFMQVQLSQSVNRNEVQTQRAVVVPKKQQIPFYRTIHQGKLVDVGVLLTIENAGATSARNVKARFNLQKFNSALPPNYDFPDLSDVPPLPTFISPRTGLQKAASLPFDDLKLAVSGQGGEYIYGWGWVTYRDAFDNTPERLTEFCFQLTNISGDMNAIPNPSKPFSLTMVVIDCPSHNCQDEDCPDYAARTGVQKN